MTRKFEEATLRTNAIFVAQKIVKKSGVEELINQWREEDRKEAGKTRPGPKPWINEVQFLTLYIAQALRSDTLQLTSMRDYILTAPVNELKAIGLERPTGLSDDAIYFRLLNTKDRLKSLMNSEFAFPACRRLDGEEYREAMRTLKSEKSQKFRRRSLIFANKILEGSIMLLPRDVRRKMKANPLDLCMDATLVESPARGSNRQRTSNSSDTTAGWYTRYGSHDGESTTISNQYAARHDEFKWGA